MIGKLIGILFLSRDVAHRMHLASKSYSQHMALDGFYGAIVDNADSIAEAYQGRHGIIDNIPQLKDENDYKDPADMLQKHLAWFEKLRYEAIEKTDSPIQNLVDEAVHTYLTAIYKLRNLK